LFARSQFLRCVVRGYPFRIDHRNGVLVEVACDDGAAGVCREPSLYEF
jgi:hypothetical protein